MGKTPEKRPKITPFTPKKVDGDATCAQPPAPLPRRRQLDTLKKLRLEIIRLYFEAREGERQPGDASKMGNLLGMAARLLESGEFERRLAELERLFDEAKR